MKNGNKMKSKIAGQSFFSEGQHNKGGDLCNHVILWRMCSYHVLTSLKFEWISHMLRFKNPPLCCSKGNNVVMVGGG